jgi:hypothetical protein
MSTVKHFGLSCVDLQYSIYSARSFKLRDGRARLARTGRVVPLPPFAWPPPPFTASNSSSSHLRLTSLHQLPLLHALLLHLLILSQPRRGPGELGAHDTALQPIPFSWVRSPPSFGCSSASPPPGPRIASMERLDEERTRRQEMR